MKKVKQKKMREVDEKLSIKELGPLSFCMHVHTIVGTIIINLLLMQAYDKGASEGVIGFIYGLPPLVVVILSPILGYVVSAWFINIILFNADHTT